MVVGWTSVGVMRAGSEGVWRKVGDEGVLVGFWVDRGCWRVVRKSGWSAEAPSSRVRVGVGSVEGASWVENGEVVSSAILLGDRDGPCSDGSDCLEPRIGDVEAEESFGEVHSHPIAVCLT